VHWSHGAGRLAQQAGDGLAADSPCGHDEAVASELFLCGTWLAENFFDGTAADFFDGTAADFFDGMGLERAQGVSTESDHDGLGVAAENGDHDGLGVVTENGDHDGLGVATENGDHDGLGVATENGDHDHHGVRAWVTGCEEPAAEQLATDGVSIQEHRRQ